MCNEAEFNHGFEMPNMKPVFPPRLYNDENIFKRLFFPFDSMFNQKILTYSILHKKLSLLLTIGILIGSHCEL